MSPTVSIVLSMVIAAGLVYAFFSTEARLESAIARFLLYIFFGTCCFALLIGLGNILIYGS